MKKIIGTIFLLMFLSQIVWALIPTITSFTPTSGPVGTTVRITGTNFNSTAANNVVYFGAVKAQVIVATSTLLTVVTPVGATYAPITVTDLTTGLTAYSAQPFIVTYILSPSFARKVDFATGNGPWAVALGDLDGDGKPDIVVTNYDSGAVSVYRNTSTRGSITNSSFAAKVDYATGTKPLGVAIGDLDGDGKPDLVVVNIDITGNSIVSVFRNTSVPGSITISSFAQRVNFPASTGQFVAIRDLDGDGKPDLAVTDWTGWISVLRNTSVPGSITSSSFAAEVDFETGHYSRGIAIGDLDGDGKPDLAVANGGNNTIPGSDLVSVLRNTSVPGSITFAAKVDFKTGEYPIDVALGDLEGDGKPDLVVTNWNSNTVSVYRNTSTSGSITSSSFTAKVDFVAGKGPCGIAIGDLNGDGKPDLVVSNQRGNKVSVFRNTSNSSEITNSSFADKVDFSTGIYPGIVAIGDVDGDGKSDLVVTNYKSNTVSVLRNTVCSTVVTNTGLTIPTHEEKSQR
jgi:hypothetical protein